MEEIEVGTAIQGPLRHFQATDLAFHGANRQGVLIVAWTASRSRRSRVTNAANGVAAAVSSQTTAPEFRAYGASAKAGRRVLHIASASSVGPNNS